MTEQDASAEPLRDVHYVCNLLGGVSRHRIYDLVRRDLLPHVRVGRRIYFDRTQLEAFIADGGRGLEVTGGG